MQQSAELRDKSRVKDCVGTGADWSRVQISVQRQADLSGECCNLQSVVELNVQWQPRLRVQVSAEKGRV